MRTKEANERSKAEQEYLKHSQHLYQNPGETMATMLFQSRLEFWRTTAVSSGKASRNCCPIQGLVGCSVALK